MVVYMDALRDDLSSPSRLREHLKGIRRMDDGSSSVSHSQPAH